MTAPAMPSSTDLMAYLRIQTKKEQALLADLLAEAVATIETNIGKSLTTEQVTWRDNAASALLWRPATSLFLGYTPIDESTVVVKDRDAAIVPASNYQIRQDLGQIVALGAVAPLGGMVLFDNGPYTITCTAGYGTSAVYVARWLPMIKMVVLDFAAMLYQQRTPGARAERAAGSVVDYEVDEATGWPKRLARQVGKLRGPVVTV